MKHAFLLMIHNNFDLTEKLLKKLDHIDNDIYIHVDKKSIFTTDNKVSFINCCKKSNIYFVNRYDVTWGGYSMINNELRILESALKGHYDYYHYISGADFPIKTMDYIHDFFKKYNGCEFIGISSDDFIKRFEYRYRVYHFLREKCGRKNKLLLFIERCLLLVQLLFGINRTKKYSNIKFKGGSNWCSITHQFALHLLNNENVIKDMFKKSLCCDEIYKQTIVYNSQFKDNIYQFKYNVSECESYLRSVDWSRPGTTKGSPYTYNIDDYDNLVNSKNLFARKISYNTKKEKELIDKLELL